MKTILWTLLILFLVGDALFVLPWHLSSDKVATEYYINYKKDSSLLHSNFPEGSIRLKLNMPPGYERMYAGITGAAMKSDSAGRDLFVNVSVFHNLDFTAVSFPFYKVTTFNGVIPFYSTIKAANDASVDSTALVGNIVINGKVTVKGISSPLYARALVEKELVDIIRKETDKIEVDINRKPVADTASAILMAEPHLQKHRRPIKK